jgi:asparagine synthase (glutamine-hydrolysing)
MCGIAGAWRPNDGRDDARDLARRMANALRHRGPDGEGIWHHDAGGPTFVHRRLAIVDLSAAGAQPMRSADGRLTLAFNGEVYNHAELRAALEREGRAPAWRGRSDTETMLAAIGAWGLRPALERFVGMFAFALWDERDRTLTLVRDRLGVKPLYVARTPGGVAFASELKALRALPDFDATLDRASLAGFVARACVPGTHTIHVGARRVPPGGLLRFTDPLAPPREERWWSAADVVADGLAHPFEGDEREAIDALDALLRDAVRLRMEADVPLGAFLSGGIDSSTVVALMQAQSGAPIHTFSIGNESALYDESDAAMAVARHLGTAHRATTITAADALALIPALPSMYDEPFADSSQIPTALVSRMARRHVTVALSGDGGDELFGGYVRHVWGPRAWDAQRRVPRALRAAAASAVRGVPVETWDRLFALAGPLAPRVRLPGLRLHKLAGVLDVASLDALHDRLASFWQPHDGVLVDDAQPHPPDAPDAPAALRGAARMMYRDLVGYLPDDVLTKVDRASMAYGLEAREPLLDHRVLAFAWRLPTSMKIRGGAAGATGKWALRRVLDRYVPEQLLSGPKMGFGVPLGDWLRGPLRPWAEELLSERALRETGVFAPAVVRARWAELCAGTRPWEHHLWAVLSFEAWTRA